MNRLDLPPFHWGYIYGPLMLVFLISSLRDCGTDRVNPEWIGFAHQTGASCARYPGLSDCVDWRAACERTNDTGRACHRGLIERNWSLPPYRSPDEA